MLEKFTPAALSECTGWRRGKQSNAMEREITKRYSNGEVTVIWKPALCIHSGNCFRGLPEVFKPAEKPWVTPEGSTTERIVAQVKKCPSGALSFEYDQKKEEPAEEMQQLTEIEVRPGGPLLVKGVYQVRHKDGTIELCERNRSFCRCGHSQKKPFCDGSHRQHTFDQDEPA